jgi:uncharacterized protein YbbC (DUF1343 family)
MFFKMTENVINSAKMLAMMTLLLFSVSVHAQEKIITGAENTAAWFPLVKDKNIALVANQTSIIGQTHLVDTMLRLGLKVAKIFSPEHGFRGAASAGEKVSDDVDSATGISLVSLYGNNKKPTPEALQGIDIMIFDLQDVGVRFYTYISTMHYVMQACAEQKIPLIILDRPNPNGFYVDGPVLQDSFASFVGMHKVPVVHGLTIGEYAQMINGEHWLKQNIACEIKVIPCIGYTHQSRYFLPVKPSPNLPNQLAIYLYPTLCFFEGTLISVGRGTNKPFQQYGHPLLMNSETSFVPKSMPGASNPPYANEVCFGYDLSNYDDVSDSLSSGIHLEILIDAYRNFPDKKNFFNSFFNKLAGNDILQKQIVSGKSVAEIKASWQSDLQRYKTVRKKYLLYQDFE